MTSEESAGRDLRELAEAVSRLREELAQVVIGQQDVVDEILVALLAGGHVLLEGVPGVAKTLLARGLAQALGLDFRRVQFTPDLMPADIVGTSVFDFGQGRFHLQRGPVFTQVLLADEINRTPPKTQAALLEAMQERQVTIDGTTHELAEPFFVVATQNPVEQEGTYPLPEAQLDRFLVKVEVGYPSAEDEVEVFRRFLDGRIALDLSTVRREVVLEPGRLPQLRLAIASVHVEESILGYLQQLLDQTRRSPRLALGGSPRAGLCWIAAARAWAAMEGRSFVLPDDVKRMAAPVLRHRLIPTPEAELDGIGAGEQLEQILERVAVPR